jgi:hypothetical protein
MSGFLCKIVEISPYIISESDGDEIFFKLNKKRVWPQNSRYTEICKEPVKVDLSIQMDELGKVIELELWEYDNILFSSCLGRFLLSVDEVGGPFICDLSRKRDCDAKYSIKWEVVKGR